MKNLTNRLIEVGILSLVLLAEINGCATNPEYIQRQEVLKKYHMREKTFSEDGLGAYISPFGFKHSGE